MKKNGSAFVLTMWWFILLFVLGCLTTFFTPSRERVSMDENRVLQNRPELTVLGLISGDFASKFESFLSDSIPGRSRLINTSDRMLNKLSFNTSEDLFYLDTTEKDIEDFYNDLVSDSDSKAEEADPQEDSEPQTAANEEACLRLITKSGKTVKLVSYGDKAVKYSAANLDKCAALLPDDGRVYFTTMSFPGVARRFCDDLDSYKGWESTLFDKLNRITCDKVICVDSYKIFEPHILQGEDLFLHTNHQWNDRGAYYVFSEIIRMQGLTPTPYDEYEYDVNKVFYDNSGKTEEYNLLYPLAPSTNWRVSHINHKTEIAFMNYHVPSTLSYLSGSQIPWKTVKTGFHTGRNALVLGDCYSLAFTPFLLPYYDSVHYTRLKAEYFDKSKLGTSVADMMARNGITDIYYISSESSGVNSSALQYNVGTNLY